jgi:hypothetical protein
MESLPSYVARIAALHGYSTAADFCSLLGLKYREIVKGSEVTVLRLEYLTSNEPGSLSSQAVYRVNHVRSEIRGHAFQKSYLGWDKVCPHCLVEDEASGTGRRGARAYGRLNWLPPHARACCIHGTALVPLPSTERATEHEFVARIKSLSDGPKGLVQSAKALKPSKLQHYCEDRIFGVGTGDIWIDRFAVHEVAQIAPVVGAIVLNHGLRERNDVECLRDADDAGFELLSQGRARFQVFLTDILDNVRQNDPRASLLRALGPIGACVGQLKETGGFNELADAVREIVQESRPVGPSNMLFGKPFVRMKHSILSAAHEYGLPFTVIRSALQEKGFLAIGTSREAAAAAVFDAAAMAQVVSEVLNSEVVGSLAVARYRQSRLGKLIVTVSEKSRGYLYTSEVSAFLASRGHVVAALADDGYLRQFRTVVNQGTAYSKIDVSDFMGMYVSAGFIRKRLAETDRTLDGFLNETGLRPVILAEEVGDDFYLRKEFELMI